MINKAILVGNLGADPEMRATQSGNKVATFNLATTERFKGKDGKIQDTTEWHRIVAWGRLAEICGEYLHKGSRVYLEGKIQTRAWDDKDGNKRYTTEIVAREVKMLSPKGGESTGTSKQQGSGWPEEPSGEYGGGTGDGVPF
jgi:single-strand DNA-binding protein